MGRAVFPHHQDSPQKITKRFCYCSIRTETGHITTQLEAEIEIIKAKNKKGLVHRNVGLRETKKKLL
jgi:hypothetical protein